MSHRIVVIHPEPDGAFSVVDTSDGTLRIVKTGFRTHEAASEFRIKYLLKQGYAVHDVPKH